MNFFKKKNFNHADGSKPKTRARSHKRNITDSSVYLYYHNSNNHIDNNNGNNSNTDNVESVNKRKNKYNNNVQKRKTTDDARSNLMPRQMPAFTNRAKSQQHFGSVHTKSTKRIKIQVNPSHNHQHRQKPQTTKSKFNYLNANNVHNLHTRQISAPTLRLSLTDGDLDTMNNMGHGNADSLFSFADDIDIHDDPRGLMSDDSVELHLPSADNSHTRSHSHNSKAVLRSLSPRTRNTVHRSSALQHAQKYSINENTISINVPGKEELSVSEESKEEPVVNEYNNNIHVDQNRKYTIGSFGRNLRQFVMNDQQKFDVIAEAINQENTEVPVENVVDSLFSPTSGKKTFQFKKRYEQRVLTFMQRSESRRATVTKLKHDIISTRSPKTLPVSTHFSPVPIVFDGMASMMRNNLSFRGFSLSGPADDTRTVHTIALKDESAEYKQKNEEVVIDDEDEEVNETAVETNSHSTNLLNIQSWHSFLQLYQASMLEQVLDFHLIQKEMMRMQEASQAANNDATKAKEQKTNAEMIVGEDIDEEVEEESVYKYNIDFDLFNNNPQSSQTDETESETGNGNANNNHNSDGNGHGNRHKDHFNANDFQLEDYDFKNEKRFLNQLQIWIERHGMASIIASENILQLKRDLVSVNEEANELEEECVHLSAKMYEMEAKLQTCHRTIRQLTQQQTILKKKVDHHEPPLSPRAQQNGKPNAREHSYKFAAKRKPKPPKAANDHHLNNAASRPKSARPGNRPPPPQKQPFPNNHKARYFPNGLKKRRKSHSEIARNSNLSFANFNSNESQEEGKVSVADHDHDHDHDHNHEVVHDSPRKHFKSKTVNNLALSNSNSLSNMNDVFAENENFSEAQEIEKLKLKNENLQQEIRRLKRKLSQQSASTSSMTSVATSVTSNINFNKTVLNVFKQNGMIKITAVVELNEADINLLERIEPNEDEKELENDDIVEITAEVDQYENSDDEWVNDDEEEEEKWKEPSLTQNRSQSSSILRVTGFSIPEQFALRSNFSNISEISQVSEIPEEVELPPQMSVKNNARNNHKSITPRKTIPTQSQNNIDTGHSTQTIDTNSSDFSSILQKFMNIDYKQKMLSKTEPTYALPKLPAKKRPTVIANVKRIRKHRFQPKLRGYITIISSNLWKSNLVARHLSYYAIVHALPSSLIFRYKHNVSSANQSLSTNVNVIKDDENILLPCLCFFETDAMYLKMVTIVSQSIDTNTDTNTKTKPKQKAKSVANIGVNQNKKTTFNRNVQLQQTPKRTESKNQNQNQNKRKNEMCLNGDVRNLKFQKVFNNYCQCILCLNDCYIDINHKTIMHEMGVKNAKVITEQRNEFFVFIGCQPNKSVHCFKFENETMRNEWLLYMQTMIRKRSQSIRQRTAIANTDSHNANSHTNQINSLNGKSSGTALNPSHTNAPHLKKKPSSGKYRMKIW